MIGVGPTPGAALAEVVYMKQLIFGKYGRQYDSREISRLTDLLILQLTYFVVA